MMEKYKGLQAEVAKKEWSVTIHENEEENKIKIYLVRDGDFLPNIELFDNIHPPSETAEIIFKEIENYESMLLEEITNDNTRAYKMDSFYNGFESSRFYLGDYEERNGFIGKYKSFEYIAIKAKKLFEGKRLGDLNKIEREFHESLIHGLYSLYLEEFGFLSELKSRDGNKNISKMCIQLKDRKDAGIPIDIIQMELLLYIMEQNIVLRKELNAPFYECPIPNILDINSLR